uniref:YoaK family protein n=1 Tax=Lachnospira sp. TaxID=2049031 RepID=UPI003FEE3641
MSESFLNGAVLAVSGGFQDAYTYFTRDKVFSNAQTGNVVLMSQEFMAGNFIGGIKYLLPFLAFGLGVLVTEQINARYKMAKRIHWRQLIILIEIAILAIVGFIPHSLNMAATVLVSFSCAMQVQAFRKVNGFAYASTMCIGNLRSGTDALSAFLRGKRKEHLIKAFHYYGIIFFFAVGAGIGGNLSVAWGIHTIWVSCILLLISMVFMWYEKYRK